MPRDTITPCDQVPPRAATAPQPAPCAAPQANNQAVNAPRYRHALRSDTTASTTAPSPSTQQSPVEVGKNKSFVFLHVLIETPFSIGEAANLSLRFPIAWREWEVMSGNPLGVHNHHTNANTKPDHDHATNAITPGHKTSRGHHHHTTPCAKPQPKHTAAHAPRCRQAVRHHRKHRHTTAKGRGSPAIPPCLAIGYHREPPPHHRRRPAPHHKPTPNREGPAIPARPASKYHRKHNRSQPRPQ